MPSGAIICTYYTSVSLPLTNHWKINRLYQLPPLQLQIIPLPVYVCSSYASLQRQININSKLPVRPEFAPKLLHMYAENMYEFTLVRGVTLGSITNFHTEPLTLMSGF